MLDFIANETIHIEAPVCWAESTVKIFQDLMRAQIKIDSEEEIDKIKVFNVITGTDYSAIAESNSEDLDTAIYQATAFFFNEPQTFRDEKLPTAIKLHGKVVKIPRHLESLTIAQNNHIRSAMTKAPNLECLVSLATAIYLQPLINGPEFNYKRAMELEKEILEMNIYEIFPIGFFLLSKLNNSGASGLLSWLRQKLRNLTPIRRTLKLPVSKDSKRFPISSSLTSMHRHTDNFLAKLIRSPLMRLCLTCFYGRRKQNFRLDYAQY